jgi:hypothetical protein
VIHGLCDLLSLDGARGTNRRAHAAADTDDFIDAGNLLLNVPFKSGAFENTGAQLVAAAILTETDTFIHRDVKHLFAFFLRT